VKHAVFTIPCSPQSIIEVRAERLSPSDASDDANVPSGGTTFVALSQLTSNVCATTSTREGFADGIFLTVLVPSCHANSAPFFPDYTRQRVHAAGCSCAPALKPPAIFGLWSVDCTVCFDHHQQHLFSFRGSVQDYKIHMNMEIVTFLEIKK